MLFLHTLANTAFLWYNIYMLPFIRDKKGVEKLPFSLLPMSRWEFDSSVDTERLVTKLRDMFPQASFNALKHIITYSIVSSSCYDVVVCSELYRLGGKRLPA